MENFKLYTISNYSKNGGHFGVYLQKLLVVATCKEQAIKKAKQWMNKNLEFFLDMDSENWQIAESKLVKGVISYHKDSDY